MTTNELFYQKLSRRLAYALVASGFLNLSLVAFGLYEWQEGGFSYLMMSPFKPRQAKLYAQSGKNLPTLTQSLRELELLDFPSLVMMIDDETRVAMGYKKKDLAISLLVDRYHFDLERALCGKRTHMRKVSYMSQDKEKHEIILYPDLAKEQYLAVAEFAKKERWPITTRGLHAELKRMAQTGSTQAEKDDSTQDDSTRDDLTKVASLQAAFRLTNEFRLLKFLLCRDSTITDDQVLKLAMASDWKPIQELFLELSKAQDLSPQVRRSFLLRTLPHSASLLYQTDERFCIQSLQDAQVVQLLQTLPPPQAKSYALMLLETPRSTLVWEKAAGKLCQIEKIDIQKLDTAKATRIALLERFGRKQTPSSSASTTQSKPQAAVKPPALSTKSKAAVKPPALSSKPKAVVKTPATKNMVAYTVKSGDTLWHIAKRFGVDVEVIKRHNKLSNDALKVGSTLMIPLPENEARVKK